MNIVPTDSTSIYAALSTLVMRDSQVVLVRPNNPPHGIAGFLLDVVEDDGSDLESDITDHYVEDNTAIQDHIALRPETITVTGKVAELVKAAPTARPVAVVPNTLPNVPELTPVLTDAAQAKQDASVASITEADAGVSSSQSLYGYYESLSRQQPGQTKQSYVYGYFYQLWKGRQLFSVETPWGIFENMAIQSMNAKQGPESRSVSEFSITFKKIRTASSITINAGLLTGRAVFGDPSAAAGRAAVQRAPETRVGIAGSQFMSVPQREQFLYQANPPRT